MNNRKLIIILTLIVLLPLALLGWQSWHMQQDSERVQQAQAASLAALRLEQVDNLVKNYFTSLARQLSNELASPPVEVESLRHHIRSDGRIRQLFVFDTRQHQRLYPPMNALLTEQEQAFVSRWQAVWNDPQILFASQSNASQEAESAQAYRQRSFSKSAQVAETMDTRQGWYTHYWGNGINLLFWQQTADGRLLGAELEPTRIKADLISLLPNGLPDDAAALYRIRLLDTAGQVIYQWGGYNPGKQAVLQTRALSYPLSSWMLEYYGDTSATGGGRYSLLLSFAGLALVVLGLAWFLYREQTREMRLAAQRVQFVSQVSHELKTPLTNVRMYAEMLEDQLDEEPQQQHYLRVIIDESERLTRLISNVLSFSRQPRIHKRLIQPNDVIRQVAEHFRPGLQAKEISIELDLQAHRETYSDPDALEQILNNLLSNAEKYAAQGKRIQISSEAEGGLLKVRVRDFGTGISRRERKRIFQPFYRIHNSLTEGVSGTGIGLTIARQQAERLGGSLALVDITPGACFELTLPLDNKENNA